MAGMEVVVRPVIFPDIRPQAPRSLPPEDDPTKGICEIKGQGSFIVNFSESQSWSVTYGKEKEMKRRVDTARVYQKEANGRINKENFVDVDVANKIWMKRGRGPKGTFKGFTGDDVVPTIEGRGYTGDDIAVQHYKRVEKADNIEIKEKDKIKKNEGSNQ